MYCGAGTAALLAGVRMDSRLLEQARQALTVTGPMGRPDTLLWDRARRVERLAGRVAAFPECAHRVLERTALGVACLYMEVCWAEEVREGRLPAGRLLLQRMPDAQREASARWIDERLGELLPEGLRRLSARIVLEAGQRGTSLPEAQILADASGLDEVGPLAVWLMVRRQQADGRGLDEVLTAWDRQAAYGYWPSWIRESLIFASSRAWAERRLAELARFMEQWRAEGG